MDDSWSWNTRILTWISSTRYKKLMRISIDNTRSSIKNKGSNSLYMNQQLLIKMLSGNSISSSVITLVNYAKICLTLHMCRISVMSIINSRYIKTSNTASSNISSSSSSNRAKIRTTSMHPLTSNSSKITHHTSNNTKRWQIRRNQCQKMIQLFRHITWMQWVMA